MSDGFHSHKGRVSGVARRAGNSRAQQIRDAQREVAEAGDQLKGASLEYDRLRRELASAAADAAKAAGGPHQRAATLRLHAAEDAIAAGKDAFERARAIEQGARMHLDHARQERHAARPGVVRLAARLGHSYLERKGFGNFAEHRRNFDESPHQSRAARLLGVAAEHFGHGALFHAAFGRDPHETKQRLDELRGRKPKTAYDEFDPFVRKSIAASAKRARGYDPLREFNGQFSAMGPEAAARKRAEREAEAHRKKQEREAIFVQKKAEQEAEAKRKRGERDQELARKKAEREAEAQRKKTANEAAAAQKREEREAAAEHRRIQKQTAKAKPSTSPAAGRADAGGAVAPSGAESSAATPSGDAAAAISTPTPTAPARKPTAARSARAAASDIAGPIVEALQGLAAIVQQTAQAQEKRDESLIAALRQKTVGEKAPAGPSGTSEAVAQSETVAPRPAIAGRDARGRFVKAETSASDQPAVTTVAKRSKPAPVRGADGKFRKAPEVGVGSGEPAQSSMRFVVRRSAAADKSGALLNPIPNAEKMADRALQAERERNAKANSPEVPATSRSTAQVQREDGVGHFEATRRAQAERQASKGGSDSTDASPEPAVARDKKPSSLTPGASAYVPLAADDAGSSGDVGNSGAPVAVVVKDIRSVLIELRALHQFWQKARAEDLQWRDRQADIDEKRHAEQVALLQEKEAESHTPHEGGDTEGGGASGHGKSSGHEGGGLLGGLLHNAESYAEGGLAVAAWRKARNLLKRGKTATAGVAEGAEVASKSSAAAEAAEVAGGAKSRIGRIVSRIAKLGLKKGAIGGLLTIAGVVGFEGLSKILESFREDGSDATEAKSATGAAAKASTLPGQTSRPDEAALAPPEQAAKPAASAVASEPSLAADVASATPTSPASTTPSATENPGASPRSASDAAAAPKQSPEAVTPAAAAEPSPLAEVAPLTPTPQPSATPQPAPNPVSPPALPRPPPAAAAAKPAASGATGDADAVADAIKKTTPPLGRAAESAISQGAEGAKAKPSLVSRVVGKTRFGDPITAADRAAGKGLGGLLKKLLGGPATIALAGYSFFTELEDLYGQLHNRKITREEFKRKFSEVVGSSVGGLAGAEIGGSFGALAGAAVAGPPGALIGGIGGSLGGMEAGSYAGPYLSNAILQHTSPGEALADKAADLGAPASQATPAPVVSSGTEAAPAGGSSQTPSTNPQMQFRDWDGPAPTPATPAALAVPTSPVSPASPDAPAGPPTEFDSPPVAVLEPKGTQVAAQIDRNTASDVVSPAQAAGVVPPVPAHSPESAAAAIAAGMEHRQEIERQSHSHVIPIELQRPEAGPQKVGPAPAPPRSPELKDAYEKAHGAGSWAEAQKTPGVQGPIGLAASVVGLGSSELAREGKNSDPGASGWMQFVARMGENELSHAAESGSVTPARTPVADAAVSAPPHSTGSAEDRAQAHYSERTRETESRPVPSGFLSRGTTEGSMAPLASWSQLPARVQQSLTQGEQQSAAVAAAKAAATASNPNAGRTVPVTPGSALREPTLAAPVQRPVPGSFNIVSAPPSPAPVHQGEGVLAARLPSVLAPAPLGKASTGPAAANVGALSSSPSASSGPAAAAKVGAASATSGELGSLSAHWESRGNAGAIGHDSTGGFSYGKYQIATQTGTFGKFMDYLGKNNPEMAARLSSAGGAQAATAGSPEFQRTFKEMAQDPKFAAAQHGFIEQTHYQPVVSRLQQAGLDASSRSKALQNVLWSTGVQHGGHTDVPEVALQKVMREKGVSDPKQVKDSDLIEAIYDERRTRFGHSTERTRQSVMNRFDQESATAQAELAKEQKDGTQVAKTATPNGTSPVSADAGRDADALMRGMQSADASGTHSGGVQVASLDPSAGADAIPIDGAAPTTLTPPASSDATAIQSAADASPIPVASPGGEGDTPLFASGESTPSVTPRQDLPTLPSPPPAPRRGRVSNPTEPMAPPLSGVTQIPIPLFQAPPARARGRNADGSSDGSDDGFGDFSGMIQGILPGVSLPPQVRSVLNSGAMGAVSQMLRGTGHGVNPAPQISAAIPQLISGLSGAVGRPGSPGQGDSAMSAIQDFHMSGLAGLPGLSSLSSGAVSQAIPGILGQVPRAAQSGGLLGTSPSLVPGVFPSQPGSMPGAPPSQPVFAPAASASPISLTAPLSATPQAAAPPVSATAAAASTPPEISQVQRERETQAHEMRNAAASSASSAGGHGPGMPAAGGHGMPMAPQISGGAPKSGGAVNTSPTKDDMLSPLTLALNAGFFA